MMNIQLDFLDLKNFRPFEELRISFHPRTNVFIGLNGAGKTAILDSIAMGFRPFVSKLSKMNFQSIAPKDTDIYIGAEELTINMYINYGDPNACKWYTTKSIQHKRDEGDYTYLNNWTARLSEELAVNPSFDLPLVAYYSTNRMNVDADYAKRAYRGRFEYDQFLAYKNALASSLNTFDDFIAWFEDEEGYEDKVRLDKDPDYRNPKLQTVRAAIERFLNALEGNRVSFKNIRIRKERNENSVKYQNQIVSSLVISKNGKDFQLAQLSSGEKMVLTLIVDIARRLSIANPSLPDPLLGNGVILIDEIDLHLHPQWQREVVPALNSTFPNCQFIVTTHSPQVLSKISKSSVYVIEDNAILKDPPSTYGKDTNSILFEIFNTLERPKHIQDKIDACYKWIELEKFEAAKVILDELTAVLGEDDNEVIKIKSLFVLYEV